MTSDCAGSIAATATGALASTAVVGAIAYVGPEALVGELLIGADDPLDAMHALSIIPGPLAAPFVVLGQGVSGIGQYCF